PSDPFPGLDVALFEGHMRWVKANCEAIAPEALGESIERPAGGRPRVLVTFDDGYRGYHDHAYPILESLGIPGLVFLATAFMDDESRMFDSDVLYLAALRTTRTQARIPWASGKTYALTDRASRESFFRACRDSIKELPTADRRPLLQALRDELGVTEGDLAVP